MEPVTPPFPPRRALEGMLPRTAIALGVVVVGVMALAAVRQREDGPDTPSLRVEQAVVSEGDEVAAAYFDLDNAGSADRLLAVDSGAASRVSVHRTEPRDGVEVMVPVADLPIGADSTTRLEPGGLHLMLEGLARPLRPGDEVTLTLTFARSAPITVRASVASYLEIADSIGDRSP